MKKRALSLFLALALCLGLTVPALAAGETLPYDIPSTVEWSFPTLTGERISQDTYPGQAVVLIFFRANETCGNSNNTIEALSHAEWAKSDQFQIVAVGCGESGESEEVVKEHADTFYQDHGSADGNIQFCYATDREMWAVVPALQQLVGGEGYTYAMVYVFDGEGHLRDAWQGSYNAQNYKNALTLLGLLDPGAGGSTSYSGLYPVTISGSNDYDSAYQVLELLNSYRRENSLSELVMDQSLLNVGMRRAAETALFYDHTRPNGDYFFTAFPLQFTQGKSSENIAAGYGTPELVMSGWKDSPGHNANMLTPEHQSVGIGAFVDRNGTRYWVQVFSGQSGTEETSQSTGVKTVTTRTESLAENLDLAVSPNSATLYAGETETLSLYNRNIGWSGSQAPIYASYAASSDEDVATVTLNEDGTVTLNALSQGSTTVQIGLAPTFGKMPLTVEVPVTVRPSNYTVTVANTQHGTVTASPTSAAAGTKVTLTVTPDSGYKLDALTVKQTDGTAVTVTNNTFTMPASNVTVTATFKELPPETYTVTVANAQHGKVTASPVKGTAGTKVTLTVTPDSGYELDTLTVKQADGKTVAVAADNTFTMPASNVTVTATFKELPPDTYTVTVATAQHGKVTASPTSGKAGTKITLTVTPDSGYELDTLTVKQANGKTVAVAADNTFTLPASNVTVSATFKALPVDRLSLNRSSVSVSVGGSASVTATVSGYAGKHVYAISSDTSVATASVSGKTVRVKGVAQGAASVYVVMADTNAMTLDQAKADPSMKEIKVTVTKASSSGGGGGGGGGGASGGSSGGSAGGSTSTTPTTPESATPTSRAFTDVEMGSWYESGVTFVVSKGLFNGVGANQFAPQQNMTRAMLMTVLARLAGQSTDGGETWYAKGMAWATAQGISDGTDPEGNITREQLVTMLYRYANSPAVDAAMGMAGFADVSAISDWAADAMRWAVQNGILTGKDGARLDPQGTATRAEVATILQRYVEKLGQ